MKEVIIEATIIKGKYKGKAVLIGPTPMFPTDLPFDVERLQLHVRLFFAKSLNKAQRSRYKFGELT